MIRLLTGDLGVPPRRSRECWLWRSTGASSSKAQGGSTSRASWPSAKKWCEIMVHDGS